MRSTMARKAEKAKRSQLESEFERLFIGSTVSQTTSDHETQATQPPGHRLPHRTAATLHSLHLEYGSVWTVYQLRLQQKSRAPHFLVA